MPFTVSGTYADRVTCIPWWQFPQLVVASPVLWFFVITVRSLLVGLLQQGLLELSAWIAKLAEGGAEVHCCASSGKRHVRLPDYPHPMVAAWWLIGGSLMYGGGDDAALMMLLTGGFMGHCESGGGSWPSDSPFWPRGLAQRFINPRATYIFIRPEK